MQHCFQFETTEHGVPIERIDTANFTSWLETQSSATQKWVVNTNFKGSVGKTCLLSDQKGNLQRVLLGVSHTDDFASYGNLAKQLPAHSYYFSDQTATNDQKFIPLAWGMGAYEFTRYRKSDTNFAKLIMDDNASASKTWLQHMLKAIYWARDLINTPTEDMGPEHFANEMAQLGQMFAASTEQIIGDDLLKFNYPAIHAVGRASTRSPRLFDLHWGEADAPKLTIVGKGVCFDTGGLDLKSSKGMLLMKKDMAGAAHALSLGYLIMALQLPVRLRILTPLVENSVAGNAYRPGDVLNTRKGHTVEVTNTDAEGRLILADALAEAASENPDLIIDFATLTGAARVALGTDVAAFFTNSDELGDNLLHHGEQTQDPLWRLPLYQPYRSLLDSDIANLCNSGKSPYGGAITAGLFLQQFIAGNSWIHFDIMAWNDKARPAHPQGADVSALRAVLAMLQQRYQGS